MAKSSTHSLAKETLATSIQPLVQHNPKDILEDIVANVVFSSYTTIENIKVSNTPHSLKTPPHNMYLHL